jgi:NAD(P)-dependent dehydrogenase (short-subunit alcohol dehydrogenase family)
MSRKRTWFITGAGRGMGTDIARAALAAGHGVVASGRDTARVSNALGQSDDLLAVKLDVTSRVDAGTVEVTRFRLKNHLPRVLLRG